MAQREVNSAPAFLCLCHVQEMRISQRKRAKRKRASLSVKNEKRVICLRRKKNCVGRGNVEVFLKLGANKNTVLLRNKQAHLPIIPHTQAEGDYKTARMTDYTHYTHSSSHGIIRNHLVTPLDARVYVFRVKLLLMLFFTF
ncbi:hypothetical protein RUM43_010001 [Polyplax serrata]|uniref:Uncharacterized protein n=1 Tax=Polyplax serrata TaxID=468196 RepID=A0AAN8S701_POLSC